MLVYLLILLSTVYLWIQRKQILHLPAPGLNLPFIGHYQMFLAREDPVHHLWNLYKKYNRGGILFTRVFGLDNVLIGDFNTLKFLFNHPSVQNRSHQDWKKDSLGKKLALDRGSGEDGPLSGVIFSQGKTWVEQRRFSLRVLREFGFGKSSMERTIQAEVSQFIHHLRQFTQEPVDLMGEFNLAVLNVLWKVLVGESFEYDDPKLIDILKRLTKLFQRIAAPSTIFFITLPWLFKIFPNLLNRQFEIEVNKSIRALMEEKIIEHQETLDVNSPRDFIDTVLIEIQNTKDTDSSFHGKAGMENLVNTLFDLFIAGAETTSTTLMWAVLYMVREQEVQRRVQEELDAVVGHSRLPSVEDRVNLPYTEAVVREIQRCGNIVPTGAHHMAIEPITVNGITLPANTMISPLMVEILKGDHWKDGMKFRPERFLDKEGRLKKDEQFIPFSIGKRQCLGETLAKVELFLFFTGLVQKYRMHQVDGVEYTEDYQQGATILPSPYKLVLQPRF